MEKAEALWRSRCQAEKEEAARRGRQAEVARARYELARLEQERSPDIDNEVRRVVLCRLADDVATAEPTKICSAGCGLAENARMFSKKQWSARAVRRCLASTLRFRTDDFRFSKVYSICQKRICWT